MTKKKYEYAGMLLKDARLKLGLTQVVVAEKLGFHGQYVSQWERGLCLPGEWMLKSVLELLNVSKADLNDALVKDATLEIEIYLDRAI